MVSTHWLLAGEISEGDFPWVCTVRPRAAAIASRLGGCGEFSKGGDTLSTRPRKLRQSVCSPGPSKDIHTNATIAFMIKRAVASQGRTESFAISSAASRR